MTLIFPLCPDHLITLLQFSVLRGCMVNRGLLAPLEIISPSHCSGSAQRHFLGSLSDPRLIPPSLHPTARPLQCTVPHEDWVDNVVMGIGQFNEDEPWSDVIGGLFTEFPVSEVQHSGLVA